MTIKVTRKWLENLQSLCQEIRLRLEQEDIDDPAIFGALLEIEAIVLDTLEMEKRYYEDE